MTQNTVNCIHCKTDFKIKIVNNDHPSLIKSSIIQCTNCSKESLLWYDCIKKKLITNNGGEFDSVKNPCKNPYVSGDGK